MLIRVGFSADPDDAFMFWGLASGAVDARGYEFEPVTSTWTSTDALLYALGIGGGTSELAFTTENFGGADQLVFPGTLRKGRYQSFPCPAQRSHCASPGLS